MIQSYWTVSQETSQFEGWKTIKSKIFLKGCKAELTCALNELTSRARNDLVDDFQAKIRWQPSLQTSWPPLLKSQLHTWTSVLGISSRGNWKRKKKSKRALVRAGKLATPAYVWARKGGKGEPITAVRVVYLQEDNHEHARRFLGMQILEKGLLE